MHIQVYVCVYISYNTVVGHLLTGISARSCNAKTDIIYEAVTEWLSLLSTWGLSLGKRTAELLQHWRVNPL